MKKHKKLLNVCVLALLLVGLLSTTAQAAGSGDVAGAVDQAWDGAATQI